MRRRYTHWKWSNMKTQDGIGRGKKIESDEIAEIAAMMYRHMICCPQRLRSLIARLEYPINRKGRLWFSLAVQFM
jgi:hypothetical protein